MLLMVDKKMLNNSPITRQSIKHALSIWGPSIPNLDGKTTRNKMDNVILSEENISPIPPHILLHYPVVILNIDVVKVNGIPFLSTISRVIKLGTCTELLHKSTRNCNSTTGHNQHIHIKRIYYPGDCGWLRFWSNQGDQRLHGNGYHTQHNIWRWARAVHRTIQLVLGRIM